MAYSPTPQKTKLRHWTAPVDSVDTLFTNTCTSFNWAAVSVVPDHQSRSISYLLHWPHLLCCSLHGCITHLLDLAFWNERNPIAEDLMSLLENVASHLSFIAALCFTVSLVCYYLCCLGLPQDLLSFRWMLPSTSYALDLLESPFAGFSLALSLLHDHPVLVGCLPAHTFPQAYSVSTPFLSLDAAGQPFLIRKGQWAPFPFPFSLPHIPAWVIPHESPFLLLCIHKVFGSPLQKSSIAKFGSLK